MVKFERGFLFLQRSLNPRYAEWVLLYEYIYTNVHVAQMKVCSP